MRFRTFLVAAVVVVAACDTDPTSPPSPLTPSLRSALPRSQATLNSASYNAAWNHSVLPLLPNVPVNLSTAFGNAINVDGNIAGTIEGPFDGQWFTVARATLWTAAGPQNLGTLPPGSASQKSYGMDLNDANMVAGWGTTHGSTGVCCGVVRGFRWSQAGGMQPLVPFEASDLAVTRGYAINSMGHVAGVVINAAGVQHAAVWFDPAVPPYLIGAVGAGAIAYDINDVGQVVGVHATGPFVWSAQDGATLLPNLGGSWNVAYAINNLGVVVGWSELPDGTIHPFRWTSSGGIEDLGLPPGATNAYARAISKSGRIAVSAEYVDAVTADVTSRLFLWADGQWFDSSSADLGSSYAGGINDELQIAGGGLSGQSAGMTAIRWDVSLTPATSTFAFTGFFAPIQNLPVVNRAKAGQGIPVKFSLGGDQGLNIFAPNYPASQQIACDGTAPVDEVEATVAAGGSSLSYDAVTGVYSYVWKSDASWAGTCRSLTVRLTDGTERSAHFRFVR